jgi:hypothetical protein
MAYHPKLDTGGTVDKATEIATLKRVAAELKDGYTGRMVEAILPYIIRCIENDMPVAMGLHECRDELCRMYAAIEGCKSQVCLLRDEISELDKARADCLIKIASMAKGLAALC